jgi:hypothetical protein
MTARQGTLSPRDFLLTTGGAAITLGLGTLFFVWGALRFRAHFR